LRIFREQAADKKVKEADIQRQKAIKEHSEKKDELNHYREFRQAETERRWKSLLGENLSIDELHEFRAGLSHLAQRELNLEVELEQKEKIVMDKTALFNTAKAEFLACLKARDKLERHRELYLTELNKEKLRLEDLEMEEFRPSRRK
jgi:hypothetical protein